MQRRTGAAAVDCAADRPKRCSTDGIAAAFVPHLPSVPTDPELLAGLVPSHRYAPGSCTHNYARPIAKGGRQGDFDVSGYAHTGCQVFIAQRRPQFFALSFPSGTGCTDQQHIRMQPTGGGQGTADDLDDGAGGCQRPAGAYCRTGSFGSAHHLPIFRDGDRGLGASYIRTD
jgi:hypothetical protein